VILILATAFATDFVFRIEKKKEEVEIGKKKKKKKFEIPDSLKIHSSQRRERGSRQ
jgi:hypothetical protein